MIIEGVDPRDTQWENDWPAYRVYFWHQPPAPDGIAQEHMMRHCDEYRLTEVRDVQQVLAWAHDRARPDQTFVVYVEHLDGHRIGLARLFGTDPNSSAPPSGATAS